MINVLWVGGDHSLHSQSQIKPKGRGGVYSIHTQSTYLVQQSMLEHSRSNYKAGIHLVYKV